MIEENSIFDVLPTQTSRNFSVLSLIILMAVVFLLFPAEASAHRMIIEEISEGKVEVGFDDGSVADNVEVVLYDDQENAIEEGTTDNEGIYEYDTGLDVERIIASDDMGHKAELTPGEGQEDQSFIQAQPAWLRASTGAGALLLAAAAGKFYFKKRGKGN